MRGGIGGQGQPQPAGAGEVQFAAEGRNEGRRLPVRRSPRGADGDRLPVEETADCTRREGDGHLRRHRSTARGGDRALDAPPAGGGVDRHEPGCERHVRRRGIAMADDLDRRPGLRHRSAGGSAVVGQDDHARRSVGREERREGGKRRRPVDGVVAGPQRLDQRDEARGPRLSRGHEHGVRAGPHDGNAHVTVGADAADGSDEIGPRRGEAGGAGGVGRPHAARAVDDEDDFARRRATDARLGERERGEEDGEELQEERRCQWRTAADLSPRTAGVEAAPELEARDGNLPPPRRMEEEDDPADSRREKPEGREERHSVSAGRTK